MFNRFVFDNICCDEYGLKCALFDISGKQTFNTQTTNLETEKSILGNNYNIISQEYNGPLEYTMQVINRDYSPIMQYQERAIKKWLCKRNQYKMFAILDKRYADICFFANINNPKSIWINDVNGLEFTVTTNSATAYSDERNNTYDFNGTSSISIYVDNDEELPIYPSMIITAKQNGDLIIRNQSNPDSSRNAFIIKNLKANEVITINAAYPIIESSDIGHNKNIYNDINKEWFYFIDGYNNVYANLPCAINFSYREYRKVGLV